MHKFNERLTYLKLYNNIVCIIGNKAISNRVLSCLPRNKIVSKPLYGNSHDPLRKIIILGCNYSCSKNRCVDTFIKLDLHRNVPIVIFRNLPVKPNIYFNYTFISSLIYSEELSVEQERIMMLLARARKHVDNCISAIHPSNFLHKLVEVQKRIVENGSKHTDLRGIAQDYRVSSSWLSRRFSELSSISFNEFMIKNRMCSSLWRITHSDLLIKTIAIELGYTQTSFGRSFKHVYKISPLKTRGITREQFI